MSDATVISAAGGDRRAFADLVEAHWERLVRFARSVVGDADAEDAVQDALVAAWDRLASLRDPAAFPAWITRVVSRTCLKRLRRDRLRHALPLVAAADVAEPRAADPASGVDVARLLAALAPRQRAVMHLTVIEGMSDGEIGRCLGIAPGSVRAHRRRARNRLHEMFDEMQGGPTS